MRSARQEWCPRRRPAQSWPAPEQGRPCSEPPDPGVAGPVGVTCDPDVPVCCREVQQVGQGGPRRAVQPGPDGEEGGQPQAEHGEVPAGASAAPWGPRLPVTAWAPWSPSPQTSLLLLKWFGVADSKTDVNTGTSLGVRG